MKRTILLLSLVFSIISTCYTQTTHDIEAGGGPNGPTPYYAPQFITIQVEDIVRWTNVGGTHNVDGRTSVFPENPESFFSGTPGQGWVFEHTFNIPGVYDFECGAFDHNLTQFGSITVLATGILEPVPMHVEFFPNPAKDVLNIKSEELITAYRVLDMNGRVILEEKGISSADLHIDILFLDQENYLLQIESSKRKALVRFRKE